MRREGSGRALGAVVPVEFTVIPGDVPLIEPRVVSAIETVWVPSVFRVTEKVPVPPLTIKLAGSVAAGSLLVTETAPVYEVAGFPRKSRAVKVKFSAFPTLTAGVS